jgi:hypothetical protein
MRGIWTTEDHERQAMADPTSDQGFEDVVGQVVNRNSTDARKTTSRRLAEMTPKARPSLVRAAGRAG